jgi:hypothetical protein
VRNPRNRVYREAGFLTCGPYISRSNFGQGKITLTSFVRVIDSLR